MYSLYKVHHPLKQSNVINNLYCCIQLGLLSDAEHDLLEIAKFLVYIFINVTWS